MNVEYPHSTAATALKTVVSAITGVKTVSSIIWPGSDTSSSESHAPSPPTMTRTARAETRPFPRTLLRNVTIISGHLSVLAKLCPRRPTGAIGRRTATGGRGSEGDARGNHHAREPRQRGHAAAVGVAAAQALRRVSGLRIGRHRSTVALGVPGNAVGETLLRLPRQEISARHVDRRPADGRPAQPVLRD